MATRAKNYLAGSGVDEEIRALLGSMVTANWRDALVARGYGYHIDVGAFSTPIQGGGAGTIVDLDQPEGAISIPAGWTLVPLRIAVTAQVPLGNLDSDETEIVIGVDRAAAWDGTGTATTEAALNMRSNVAGSGPLTVRSAFTVDITAAPVLGYELAHAVKIFDTQTAAGVMLTDLSLVYEPKTAPFIVGPACVYLYWGGTVATTGFANADVLVLPSDLVTNLV